MVRYWILTLSLTILLALPGRVALADTPDPDKHLIAITLCDKIAYIIYGKRIINWKLILTTPELRDWFAITYKEYIDKGNEVVYWKVDEQFDFYCSES